MFDVEISNVIQTYYNYNIRCRRPQCDWLSRGLNCVVKIWMVLLFIWVEKSLYAGSCIWGSCYWLALVRYRVHWEVSWSTAKITEIIPNKLRFGGVWQIPWRVRSTLLYFDSTESTIYCYVMTTLQAKSTIDRSWNEWWKCLIHSYITAVWQAGRACKALSVTVVHWRATWSEVINKCSSLWCHSFDIPFEQFVRVGCSWYYWQCYTYICSRPMCGLCNKMV